MGARLSKKKRDNNRSRGEGEKRKGKGKGAGKAKGKGAASTPASASPGEGKKTMGILCVHINGAKELPKVDSVGQADPFCLISFSDRTYRTKTVSRSTEPTWDQEVRVVLGEGEREFKLVCSVYDKDVISGNDFMGSCQVDIAPFLAKPGETHNIEVTLRPRPGAESTEEDTAGLLSLSVTFHERNALEKRFWKHMISIFDADGNEVISPIELTAVLEGIGSALCDEDVKKLFELGDLNKDGQLDCDELVTLFQRADAQSLVDITRFPQKSMGKPVGDEAEALMWAALNLDPATTNSFVIRGFLTEAQASRGWVGRAMGWVNFGKYQIGEATGNILVHDRSTGVLIEEKIPPYIKLSLRALYQNQFGSSATKGGTVTKMLNHMTISQGKKYNDPKSKEEIPGFINYHGLLVEEMLEPMDSFQNFNEFFYRKLKPDARPIAEPDDDSIVVAAADSRLNAFPTISQATEIWIKGSNFTLANFLNDEALAGEFDGGALVIFRLAPQDYHRFHSPVSGTLTYQKMIDGDYFTVNPMAIRENINVYTRNKRCVNVIETEHFGNVVFVAIGATMVGSIIMTGGSPGHGVKKGDELGYFAFGGSTTIAIFKKDTITFDDDLVKNSAKGLETLSRVGMRIGVKNA